MTPFKTIAGRWHDACEASGINDLPTKDRALCLAMWYAGFKACMETNMDLAEIPDEKEAMAVMALLHGEMDASASLIVKALKGELPTQ